MFAKVKSSVFIDTLQLELVSLKGNSLKAVLKDEKGSVCSTLEKNLSRGKENITWEGLNELPYGVYTLELSHGPDEMKMQLVKRV
jgi:hypothetical protein